MREGAKLSFHKPTPMPPWPCIATPPQPPPHQLLKINQIHVPLLRRRRSREAATCSRRRRTRPVSSGQNRKRDLIASATDRSPRRPFSTPARRRAAFRPPHASFAWRLEQLARVGRRALPVPEVEVWGREVSCSY